MKKIYPIIEEINYGKFVFEKDNFAGSGLIITDKNNHYHHQDDIIIFTPHAKAFSWLVYRLKAAYLNELNYYNKFDFYSLIAHAD